MLTQLFSFWIHVKKKILKSIKKTNNISSLKLLQFYVCNSVLPFIHAFMHAHSARYACCYRLLSVRLSVRL